MRTLRVPLAGAIILGLLGGLSMAVVAQDREAAVTFVTGTAVETSMENEARAIDAWDVDWSDPRLPATLWVDTNWGGYGGGLDTVMTVEMRLLLEDAAGRWQGTGRAVETADDRYSYYELTGEGAYEGLHALLRGTPGIDISGPWDEEYEGFIFESELPPFPDPIEPSAD